MPSVAQIVSDIVDRRPFLEEGLARGIINYAYLADMLKPEIENTLGKEVHRYAIVMAIRRLADGMGKSFVVEPANKLGGAEVTITSGVFEMTVRKDARALRNVSRLYEMVDFSKGDFLTITHGMYEMTIISNKKYKEKMAGMFSRHEIIKETGGLSSLIVKIPEEASEAVGVLYTLTKALSWENINIVEVVSTFTEEIFIIKEEDAALAFGAVNRIIGSK